MSLDEQIIQCARDNGYDGETTITHRKPNEWRIYYVDKDNSDAIFTWIVTDNEFKKWQRNYKLKKLI